jgi:hypothetical protein
LTGLLGSFTTGKTARIANAQANKDMHPSEKGGENPAYEKRSKEDLMDKAQDVGIEGRSSMDKDELIRALRNH